MSDPIVRELARELSSLKRHVRQMEVASQAAFRSVEEGSFDFYDEDGILRERVGKQLDGTYGRQTVKGVVPPAPTEPDVVVISDGVVAVTWDGRFEEAYDGKGDFRNVQIHLGDSADFATSRQTQEGAIFARRGGTVVVVTESDVDQPQWIRLVATNRAGEASPPSVATLVDELDEDDLEEEEELEWEANDLYVLTAADITAGVATAALTYIPEVESITAFWGSLPQEPTEYTVDYETKTVTWPLDGFERAGQRLWFHYAHRIAGIELPFGAPGWKYLQVATTDATDRSGVAYDDSGFATGATPISDQTGPHGFGADWLSTGTVGWADNTDLWLRRSLAATPGQPVTVTVRVDNFVHGFYWNGTLLAAPGTAASSIKTHTFTVPGGAVLATNVLALRVGDETQVSGANRTYVDVAIEGAQ